MSNLRTQIEALAAQFTTQILTAMRSASLDELVGVGAPSSAPATHRGPGRPRKIEVAVLAANVPAGGVRKPGRPRKSGGRLARRSPEELKAAMDKVVAFVGKSKAGVTAEQIKAGLKMDTRELPRLIQMALSAKALSKKGEKRATRYFGK